MTKKTKVIVNSLVLLVVAGLIGAGIWAVTGKQSGQDEQKRVEADTWDQLQADGSITIGLDDTFVPMGFRDTSGDLVGYDVDLANAVFKELGLKVNWQPIDWAMKETELNTGNIDAIWNGYTITDARKKKVAFSTPYHQATQVVVVKTDSGIVQLPDMKDKIIGLQNASSGEETFNDNPDVLKQYVKDQKAVGYDTFDKAFIDLNAGRIDGLLIDQDYAKYYIAHQDNSEEYRVISGDFPDENMGVGFRKADVTLRENVNRVLAEFEENGQLEAIQTEWFGE